MSRGGPPPPSPAAASRPDGGVQTYRRNAATRMVGVAAAALFVSGSISSLILSGPGAGFAFLGLLALLSLVNLVTSWGDRLNLDTEGIEQRNLLLTRLGVRPRRLAWSEITEVREHRGPASGRSSGAPRALVLASRSGQRMILDSLERYDEVIRAVAERVPGAQEAAAERVPGNQ